MGLVEDHASWESKAWCESAFRTKVDEFKQAKDADAESVSVPTSPNARSLKRSPSSQTGGRSRGKKAQEQTPPTGWIQIWNEETLKTKHPKPIKSAFADIDHLHSHAAAGFFDGMSPGPEQVLVEVPRPVPLRG